YPRILTKYSHYLVKFNKLAIGALLYLRCISTRYLQNGTERKIRSEYLAVDITLQHRPGRRSFLEDQLNGIRCGRDRCRGPRFAGNQENKRTAAAASPGSRYLWGIRAHQG